MQKMFVILLVLAAAGAAFGQLSGPLSGILGPGTFTVIGNIRVDTSQTLTIVPSTTLDFQGPFPFDIYGVLTALGMPGQPIIFTTSTQTGTNRWRGLRFQAQVSSGSSLAHCIIEKGYALGASMQDNSGGGIFCTQSSPHFAHCLVQNNFAIANGGGVYCEYSRAIFDTCTITADTAQSIHPFNWWGAGGVLCVYGRETFTGCTIHHNVTLQGNGGGAWIEWDTASFVDCDISYNLAQSLDGGGVYTFWHAIPTFTNCGIHHNTANRDGGGIYCDNTSVPTYAFCTLSDNATGGFGGGAFFQDSPPPNGPILNSTIIAFSIGEGIYFLNSTGSAISYCDFFGNSAGDFGGAVPPGLGLIGGINANGDPCDAFMNILLDPQFVNRVGNDFHIVAASRCIGAADPLNPPLTDFEGQQRPDPPGSNPDIGMDENVNATPTPCPPLSGALAGSIGPGLYCITGNIMVLPFSTLTIQPGTTFDFQGPYSFRIVGILTAIGTAGSPIVFTTSNQAGANRWRGMRFGGHWSSSATLAYCTIENAYATGATWADSCGGGVYCSWQPMPLSLSNCTIRNCAADLYGGGVFFRYCSPQFSNCTINGDTAHWPGAGGGVYLRSSSATFNTCVISGNWAGLSGGGVWCDTAASPTFRHCQVLVNTAAWDAGGIYCDTLSAAIFDTCSITVNTATNGGGVYCRLSSPTFTGCKIGYNTGTSLWGGVVCGDRSSPSFTNCDISNNTGTARGGGVWCWLSTPNFTNCLVAGNSATLGGGFGCDWNSSPTLRHCTIYGNTATTGAGVYVWGSSPTINSTIVAFSNGQGIYFQAGAASQVRFCDIYGNTGGNIIFFNNDPTQGPFTIGQLTMTNANGDPCDMYWNIFLDPLFLNGPAGDFHLTDYSRCLGAGDNNGLVATDFEGQPRPNPPVSNPDIGMDEHWLGGPVGRLVITMVSGNAVLYWPSFANSYNIYGATAPYTAGTQLATGIVGTTWTDINTSSRPSPYFYYVTGQ